MTSELLKDIMGFSLLGCLIILFASAAVCAVIFTYDLYIDKKRTYEWRKKNENW